MAESPFRRYHVCYDDAYGPKETTIRSTGYIEDANGRIIRFVDEKDRLIIAFATHRLISIVPEDG